MKNNDGFTKAMMTTDFIFFADNTELDDNGSVKMYDRKTGRLISNNYRANQEMHELLMYYKYEWISKDLQYARKCMMEEHKVQLAMEFAQDNSSTFKKHSHAFKSVSGKFNQALKKVLGVELNLKELRKVKSFLWRLENKKGLSL